MNPGRGLSGSARIVCVVLGLVLTAAGAYGIAYWAGMDLSQRWSVYIDRAWYYSAPARGWWSWALGVGGALLLVVGAGIVVACLRPRRARPIALEPTKLGRLDIAPAALGEAVGATLSALPQVRSVRARDRTIRGRGTVTFVVSVAPDCDLDRLDADMRPLADHIVDALGGRAPRVRFLLDVAKPDARPARLA